MHNRVNIYKSATLNHRISDNKYVNERASDNWDSKVTDCRGCLNQVFELMGTFSQSNGLLSWILSSNLTIKPGDPVVLYNSQSPGVYKGVVKLFTNTPIQEL